MVLCVKTLEKMIKKLSNRTNLSKMYTNHCIRVTCITILDGCGMESRQMMSVSGHKWEASIRSYSKTSKGTRLEISSYLSERTSSTPMMENKKPWASKNEVPQKNIQASRKSSHSFQSLHLTLAERFQLETFVPSFNLKAGIDMPDSDNYSVRERP